MLLLLCLSAGLEGFAELICILCSCICAFRCYNRALMFWRLNMFLRMVCFVVVVMCISPSFAAIDTHEFNTEDDRLLFHGLIEELRCPKCQNQNLADSNSQISIDLRAQVARLIEEGKTEEEVKSYMVQRYGEFVLYKPPVEKGTLVLWLAPSIMLLIGLLIFGWVIFQRTRIVVSDDVTS